jgi:hypothetical protein
MSGLYSVYDMLINEWCAGSGKKIGRRDLITGMKPNLALLCPLEITHDLTWDRTQAAALENRWLDEFGPHALSVGKYVQFRVSVWCPKKGILEKCFLTGKEVSVLKLRQLIHYLSCGLSLVGWIQKDLKWRSDYDAASLLRWFNSGNQGINFRYWNFPSSEFIRRIPLKDKRAICLDLKKRTQHFAAPRPACPILATCINCISCL